VGGGLLKCNVEEESAMALTRSESITLVIFLLALTLNIILLDEDLLRLLGMCGEGLLQTSCEVD
jgi:hypothetical protein